MKQKNSPIEPLNDAKTLLQLRISTCFQAKSDENQPKIQVVLCEFM